MIDAVADRLKRCTDAPVIGDVAKFILGDVKVAADKDRFVVNVNVAECFQNPIPCFIMVIYQNILHHLRLLLD